MLLEELEHVDHILEEQGISLVKLDNPIAALEMFNVDIIPAIVHYQFKQPHLYNGDLTNEKKIVKWVLDIRENAWSLAYDTSMWSIRYQIHIYTLYSIRKIFWKITENLTRMNDKIKNVCIWLIVRCSRKSSLFCQQKSDAL